MLSQELRPTTWDEVAGQKENIEILKAIVKNPDTAPKSLIFSGFFGTGKCVDQDTRVHTNLGYLKIKDIVPKKEQSFDSSGFMDISYKHIKVRGGYEASHLYYGGLKRTIKISSNLFSLEGTPNHRVLVMNDHGIYWKYLRDIRVMDRVCFCSDDTILFNNPTGDIPKFSHNDSEFLKGYLVGLLICSGDFRVPGVVSISTSDSMGKYFLSMFDSCHTHIQSSLDDLEYSFEVYDKDLYSWGTEHQLGSCDSSIPEWVFSTNKDFLAGVLSSLFDILGVPSKGIFYTWKDALMNGIRDILTLFGIVSKNVHNNGYHGLQIHGDYNMVKFNHIIHLKNVSKKQDMNNTCSELSYFDGSFQFLTVESVTESTSVVYDLTVPESHVFMGNGLVNHNTTCCRILARELNHIKDKNFDILNSPYLYEFDSTVIGNVDNIRNLREQFTVSYGDYWRVIVLDECIGSNGRVSSENGKTYRIADIVNKKLKIKVKSYNKETGVIEYKPITGWFKNSKKIIYEVRTSNHGKLLCSDNHVLITPKGDIQLKNLKVGDTVYLESSIGLKEDKIVSITQVYKTPVDTYDIEVKDNHNYFVGNILVHNCHTISQAAQNALLKMLEENVGRNMFVLATTEINKVLPTIRSRSLELTFTSVPYDDIIKNLNGVCQSKDIELSDKVKSLIADRSGGHMRNAHMLLDKYLLLGEAKFIESVKSAVTMYCEFLTAVHKGDKGSVLSSLNELLNIPKDNLESDWNTLMDESMKSFCGFPIVHQEVKNMLGVWGSDFNIVIQCYMSDWVNKMFMDMPYFQATMLNLYIVLSNALKRKSSTAPTSRPSTNSVSSRFGKAVR